MISPDKHVRAWALRIWRMHMQIIGVGVTNRHAQQKSMIYTFCGPFWTALTHIRTFSCYFRHFNSCYHWQVHLEFQIRWFLCWLLTPMCACAWGKKYVPKLAMHNILLHQFYIHLAQWQALEYLYSRSVYTVSQNSLWYSVMCTYMYVSNCTNVRVKQQWPVHKLCARIATMCNRCTVHGNLSVFLWRKLLYLGNWPWVAFPWSWGRSSSLTPG